MDAISSIIRQLLLDLSLAGETNGSWPIFIAMLPDQPNNSLGVYDTSGKIDGRMMRTGEQIEHPGCQILVRANDYEEGMSKAKAIASALDSQMNQIVELASDRVYKIVSISRPAPILPLGIGDDDRQRFHFSINALLTVRQLN